MMSFVRSNLRRMSMRWAPREEALREARRSCKKGRQKWEYLCASCNEYHPRKNVQADHITPCGSLKEFSDAGGFIERMLVEKSGYDVLCKKCHLEKTRAQRQADEGKQE
jgi:hypothetical protein